jgi:hypothetical protein
MSRPIRQAVAASLTCAILALPAAATAQEPAQTRPPASDPGARSPAQTLPPASDPSAQGAPAPSSATPQPQPAPKPAPGAADGAIRRATEDPGGDGGISPALVVLLIAAAAVAIALALVAAARWWVWEPRWLVRWRHATAEAGWRTGTAWSEFADWLRLGR